MKMIISESSTVRMVRSFKRKLMEITLITTNEINEKFASSKPCMIVKESYQRENKSRKAKDLQKS